MRLDQLIDDPRRRPFSAVRSYQRISGSPLEPLKLSGVQLNALRLFALAPALWRRWVDQVGNALWRERLSEYSIIEWIVGWQRRDAREELRGKADRDHADQDADSEVDTGHKPMQQKADPSAERQQNCADNAKDQQKYK
jgi:hypothetical protein